MTTFAQREPRPSRRRPPRRPACPRVEGLEARALLAVSPFDPGFNSGQPIYSTGVDFSRPTAQNSASAVAVQKADGKIVVVGTNATGLNDTSPGSNLAIRRYNPDGSLDTTFGTGGEADVPLTLPAGDLVSASSDVLIQPDGKIVLAADLSTSFSLQGFDYYRPAGTLVVRLDASGSLDPTFGTGGVTTITTDDAYLTHLALQPADGKIVLGGIALPSGATKFSYAAARLGTDGAVDPAFNGGNLLVLDPATFGTVGGSFDLGPILYSTTTLAGVLPTESGTTLLALRGGLARLKTDGTVDTSFGTAGTGLVATARGISAAALQADGKVVLGGNGIYRLNGDGTPDTTFAVQTSLVGPSALVVQPDGRIVVGGLLDLKGGDFKVGRVLPDGGLDTTFGRGGTITIPNLPTPAIGRNTGSPRNRVTGLAVASSGAAIAVGTVQYQTAGVGPVVGLAGAQFVVAQLRDATPASGQDGDYDGDNRSDLAARLASGDFAVRTHNGDDRITPFGGPGAGQMIPLSGDYDGDGKADVAGYLVQAGIFAYRPSSGGPDVFFRFGTAGVGGSIPLAGDFDGDGKTDFAVYLPASGDFAIAPSGGSAAYLTHFGSAGTLAASPGTAVVPGPGSAGPFASIPAVGDYNGDGRSDIAVYLPASGDFAILPSYGTAYYGAAYLVHFGSAGVGQSIPAVGDYDGDGQADPAVYLPAFGGFAIKPSGGSGAYLVPFGPAGPGLSVPAPGDYDGDGKTDVAAYFPGPGIYGYRPSGGGGDVTELFGPAGAGSTVPATSTPFIPTVLLLPPAPFRAAASYADVPLTVDTLAEIAATKKKS